MTTASTKAAPAAVCAHVDEGKQNDVQLQLSAHPPRQFWPARRQSCYSLQEYIQYLSLWSRLGSVKTMRPLPFCSHFSLPSSLLAAGVMSSTARRNSSPSANKPRHFCHHVTSRPGPILRLWPQTRLPTVRKRTGVGASPVQGCQSDPDSPRHLLLTMQAR